MKYCDMTEEQKKNNYKNQRAWRKKHPEKEQEYRLKAMRKSRGIKLAREATCVYTVYNNYTDELVILDGTAKECAQAMHMKESSFYSIVTKALNGTLKKWHITKSKKGMTNFENIKTMTVDKLAEFICGIYDGFDDYLIEGFKIICGDVIPNYDEDNIKQWLLQEVSKNEI